MSGYPGISFTKLGYACSKWRDVQNEISQLNLIQGFIFYDTFWYPEITRDIMVYAGFRDARRHIPESSPQDLLRTPLRTRGYQSGISWVIPVYLVISLACQLDDSCPVAARESLHTTVGKFLFLCMLTTQCIKFVLVQIRGLSRWQQSRARPTASAGTPIYRAVWGFSSSIARLVASHSPKKCHPKCLSKLCVTQNMQRSLSFACIFKFMPLYMNNKKTWKWCAYWYDKYAKICIPFVWLT